MKLHTNAQRWITGGVLAAVLATTLVPVAEAKGHGRGRYKGGHGYGQSYPVRTYYRAPSSVYYVRQSNAGAVIGGFIGGLFLGATLANAAPAGYTYYDPYANHTFVSLTAYDNYYRVHRFRHPRVVRVIEVRSGACVREYQYGDQGWSDDGYRGNQGDGYPDDRYYQDDRAYPRDGGNYDGRGDQNWDDQNE
jgi:hypothetical protein